MPYFIFKKINSTLALQCAIKCESVDEFDRFPHPCLSLPSEAANGSKVRTAETGAKRASPSPVSIQLFT